VSTPSLRGIRVVRFADFELDVRAGELLQGERKIRLQDQPHRILTMLLEHPGEVVLREEICKRLWPNGTVVEVSHGINAAVLRLREALGDSAENPRFVGTVARRGYRFLAAVEVDCRPAPCLRREPAPGAFNTESLAGRSISHFRLEEMLGRGGMGVVYRAEDLSLGRMVALKFLCAEMASDSAAVSRFQREARMASALNHPNICTVHAVEECAGQPVIVMELLEGRTLEAILAAGPMPAAEALPLAIQMAAALDAAHRRQIVHLDLKPGNVMVTGRPPAGPCLKVLDFGLAKQSVSGAARPASRPASRPPSRPPSPVTEAYSIAGTPHYMAPERFQEKEADARSDLYSFGLVLLEMLTGCRTAEGLKRTLPAAAADLEPVLCRALEANPEERWQTARDLKAALEWVAASRVSPPPAAAAAVAAPPGAAVAAPPGAAVAAPPGAAVAAPPGAAVAAPPSAAVAAPPAAAVAAPPGAAVAAPPGAAVAAPTAAAVASAPAVMPHAPSGAPTFLARHAKAAVSGIAAAVLAFAGLSYWKDLRPWAPPVTTGLPRLARGEFPSGPPPLTTVRPAEMAPARGPQPAAAVAQTTRLTEMGPAISGRLGLSPDGRLLAYSSAGQVYVRPMEGGEARVVSSDTGTAGTPFWSPDGRSLAFTRGGKLFTVSAEGGPAKPIGESKTSLAGAWGPDGTILIGAMGDGLVAIPSSGGAARAISAPDSSRGETRHLLPQFLPGGRQFLYTAGSNKPGEGTLYAGALSAGSTDAPPHTAILQTDSGVSFVPRAGPKGYLLFSRAGFLMAQRFDAHRLRTEGEAFPVAGPITSNAASAATAIAIPEFSATPNTLVYRSVGARPSRPSQAGRAGGMFNVDALPGPGLVVMKNWMASLPR